MKIVNNPFDILMRAVEELYPDIHALIQFDPDLRGLDYNECGCTIFPEDPDKEILVNVSTNIPFEAMIGVLAHELAHVVVGFDKENDIHGEKWEAVLDSIHSKYNELLELAVKKYVETVNTLKG